MLERRPVPDCVSHPLICFCFSVFLVGLRLSAVHDCATRHRCENDYVYSYYIAEWWNSWSNVPGFLLGALAVYIGVAPCFFWC